MGTQDHQEQQPDLPAIERRLRAQEAELVARTDEMTRPPTELSSIGFGKRVGDGTQAAVDRMVAVGTHEQLLLMLEQVRHALTRLESGDYGTCESCGRPIPGERLEIRPIATRCVRCS